MGELIERSGYEQPPSRRGVSVEEERRLGRRPVSWRGSSESGMTGLHRSRGWVLLRSGLNRTVELPAAGTGVGWVVEVGWKQCLEVQLREHPRMACMIHARR